jgi:YebC/PmpR family DNA-binding regulatory protein
MSGHSHWSQIRHKKAAVDKKRGAVWSKLVRAVIMAARSGGANPDLNFKLRLAIDKAKAANVPRDTLERAVGKGSGDDGTVYEEFNYEGYGPGGVAMLLRILTDNRNRTAGEIRKIFERHNGNMGAPNTVAWQFKRLGLFTFPLEAVTEDKLMEVALEAGAEDVQQQGKIWQVTCQPDSFQGLKEAFAKAGLTPEVVEISMMPTTSVPVDAEMGRKVLSLMEEFDDHEDVQEVYANFDMPDEVMAQISAGK